MSPDVGLRGYRAAPWCCPWRVVPDRACRSIFCRWKWHLASESQPLFSSDEVAKGDLAMLAIDSWSDSLPKDNPLPEAPAEHVPQEQQRYKYVKQGPRFFELQRRNRKLLEDSFHEGLDGLQIPGCYYSAHDAAMALTKLAYTLWGDADYVQPGLLSHSERARLDGMQLPYVLAEGNTWSMRFIRSGAEHVRVQYASAEKAARAWDDLACKRDRWLAVLNFPADYGLPEPQPAPERDRSQLVEQPCPSLSTSVRWNSWGGVWHLAASCKRKLKDHGIRVPTTYLFQSESIRALQMISMCLWGNLDSFCKDASSLLSTDEMDWLYDVHKCVQWECYRDGKLAPELVARSATVGMLLAKVAATSSKHRRAATKHALGGYTGVLDHGSQGRWRAEISSVEDGEAVVCRWFPFDGKKEPARIYDAAALHLDRGGSLSDLKDGTGVTVPASCILEEINSSTRETLHRVRVLNFPEEHGFPKSVPAPPECMTTEALRNSFASAMLQSASKRGKSSKTPTLQLPPDRSRASNRH